MTGGRAADGRVIVGYTKYRLHGRVIGRLVAIAMYNKHGMVTCLCTLVGRAILRVNTVYRRMYDRGTVSCCDIELV